jgi:quinol-cytochrome oxidoreductase complex cytochrome b subunit
MDDRFDLTPVIEKNLTRKQVPRTLSWAGCFGGLAFLIFLIQIFTGILLLMYYKSDAERAWDSVTFVKSNVPMGWLIQRIHSVGANFMIALVFLHMARVAYLRIYRRPRELHWISGRSCCDDTMLALRYLLPWTVYLGPNGTEIPGGPVTATYRPADSAGRPSAARPSAFSSPCTSGSCPQFPCS